MIMVQALLISGVAASEIRSYPLDPRSIYTVHLGREAPTTCVFPGGIKALIGANVSTKPDDSPGVLLSHEAGAEYFSLRAMKDGATGALNILFRGEVYALAFTTGGEADRAVVFLDEPLTGATLHRATPEGLRALVERTRQLDRLAAQYPGMASTLPRAQPGNTTAYRGFTATVEDVARFDAEDVLVFRIRLENPGESPVDYDPAGLAVRLGMEVFPAGWAEASGSIPPKAATRIFLAVPGGARGRANLRVNESYNVIVTHP